MKVTKLISELERYKSMNPNIEIRFAKSLDEKKLDIAPLELSDESFIALSDPPAYAVLIFKEVKK
jgi:hypothetical protein